MYTSNHKLTPGGGRPNASIGYDHIIKVTNVGASSFRADQIAVTPDNSRAGVFVHMRHRDGAEVARLTRDEVVELMYALKMSLEETA